MIVIENAMDKNNNPFTLTIDSTDDILIDARKNLLLPALIDPHVHFRTPGLEHKENWITAAKAALYGGITTVFDMPNTIPATTSFENLVAKKNLIDAQLREVSIPLNYGLYLGADKFSLDQIEKAKNHIVGVKLFMGSSTGNLVMDDEESLHKLFSICSKHNLVLAIHAEDECLLKEQQQKFSHANHAHFHSQIRSREVCIKATQKAIELSKMYNTKIYLLHIGTKEEVELIKNAKENSSLVYAETTPHHLFLTEDYYEAMGNKVKMNPAIRKKEDNLALWEALKTNVIDTIGSDHAPHTLEEKSQPYHLAPSGIPGVETTLPLLLNAVSEKKITLEKILQLCRTNIEKIFTMSSNDDWILVDLNKIAEIKAENLKTKCKWSPYEGRKIEGWPIKTILKGKVYDLE